MAQTTTHSISHSDKKKESWKKGVLKLMILSGCCFLVLMATCCTQTIKATLTSGQSMSPTILDDSTIYYSESLVLKERLKRFDIIVFKKTNDQGQVEKIAKRVIGLPGDHVVIRSGKLYVNDELITEDYLNETLWGDAKDDQCDQVIPEGYVFVLGDNRNFSKDSRNKQIGLVSLKTDYLGLYLTSSN